MIGKLRGAKKAAILLLALGEDTSSEVIKNLSDKEVQQIGYYMTRIDEVDNRELDSVLHEFYSKMFLGHDDLISAIPSSDFIKQTLLKAFGEEKANEILDNLGDHQGESGLVSLKWLDAKVIAQFVYNEHPQTIALILAHLEDPEKMALVLKELPEIIQPDVTYRMAILEAIPPGVIKEIDVVLTREMQTSGALTSAEKGGLTPVAEMLNSMEKKYEENILNTIEYQDPLMAEQIKELMFTFDDIVSVESASIPVIISEIDINDLVLSLKTASDKVKELFFDNMSSRQKENVMIDLEELGPVRVSDIDMAQQKIVQIVRRLEEEGRVIIRGKGDGDLI